MCLRLRRLCLLACAMSGCTLLGAEPAVAIGYYNLPGNLCQCFGYGNGSGYHSCLVLGPITPHGCCDPHEVRLACPPRPPYEYGGGSYYDPSYYSPSSPPTPGPYPPQPSAYRPQVLR
jgi:hypothetical protein